MKLLEMGGSDWQHTPSIHVGNTGSCLCLPEVQECEFLTGCHWIEINMMSNFDNICLMMSQKHSICLGLFLAALLSNLMQHFLSLFYSLTHSLQILLYLLFTHSFTVSLSSIHSFIHYLSLDFFISLI